jgi:hypothetical protein
VVKRFGGLNGLTQRGFEQIRISTTDDVVVVAMTPITVPAKVSREIAFFR